MKKRSLLLLISCLSVGNLSAEKKSPMERLLLGASIAVGVGVVVRASQFDSSKLPTIGALALAPAAAATFSQYPLNTQMKEFFDARKQKDQTLLVAATKTMYFRSAANLAINSVVLGGAWKALGYCLGEEKAKDVALVTLIGAGVYGAARYGKTCLELVGKSEENV